MYEEDEEWILEWMEKAENQKFDEIKEEWSLDKIESHYNENETSIFKAGVNQGLEKAMHLFGKTFYYWNKDQIEQAEQEIAEVEDRLEDMEDTEEKREMVEDLEETRQIIQRVKKKRENFLKPVYEEEEE